MEGCKHKSDSETDKHNYRPISLLISVQIDGVYGGVNYYHAYPWTGTWTFDAISHSILLRMNSPATFSQYPRAQRLSVRK